ncbi:MAG TPA: Calx-beta domain-containing protein [Methylomirabilota bacterium]
MKPSASPKHLLSLVVLVSVLFAAAVPAAQAAKISVINLDGPGEGFNSAAPRAPVGGNPGTTLGAQRLIAFRFAAKIWGAGLSSPVTIRVGATFDPLPCNAGSAVLGAAGPSLVVRDFPGAPAASTWYASALADARFGADLVPGVDDIIAFFNSSIGTTCLFPNPWYYGLDANPPPGQIDFVTVVLHELGHGLGFLTVVQLASGAKLAGFDDAFMRFLERHGASPAGYPSMSNGQRVAASVDTGNLHWVGPNVRAAAGGELSSGTVGDHVRMFAPNPQQPGSSVSHWDSVLVPNQLMEPSYTMPIHDPTLELALFQDIGWRMVGPNIKVKPASKNYGNVFIGSTSDQVFKVKNTGDALLSVSGTSITGPFSIESGGGAVDLAPGAVRNVTVRFTPTAPTGAKSGTLQVTSDDPDTPTLDVALTGTAVLPIVTIAVTDAAAGETGPNTGAFKVSRTGPVTDPLVVDYTTSGTATSGDDYTALSGTVTILAGKKAASIVVTPVDDAVAGEGKETVIVTLAADTNYIVGAPSAGTVKIADNDQAFEFTAAAFEVVEGVLAAKIGVKRVGGLATRATVMCRTAANTAVAGQDYTDVNRKLVFEPGVSTMKCKVPILNDSAPEGDETVDLELHTPTGPNARLGTLVNAVLTINDND